MIDAQFEGSLNASPPADRALDWMAAHDKLLRLAARRAHLDWEEGSSLLAAFRAGVHLHLGFGSFAEYVERLFGYKPRWTEERLRVAEALEGLPTMGRALRDGSVSWSALRELTRVATSDNEHEWLQVARERTARQIEEIVAGHRPGDRPQDRLDRSLRKYVLRFEVSAETMATFREAMAKLRREAGSSIDDDAAVLLLARQILVGPTDSGRASYQVALTICEHCRRGWQDGSGEQIELSSEAIEMAACDVQDIGRISGHASDAVPHVGGGDHIVQAARRDRARQNVPPAVRREVMRRDGHRCVVPGCRHGTFLDLHHLVLRSEGGDHDPDTLVVLCGAHHRAEHRGELIIEGRVSSGLVFRHSDGTRYGTAVNPRAAATHTEAFQALRGLGFREGEIRSALGRLRSDGKLEVGMDGVLRQALAILTGPRIRIPPAVLASP